MDLPVTATTPTMLNKSLEHYKALYSKYVDAHVSLHNYHTVFVKHLGLDSSIGLRKSIRELALLETELKKAVRAAFEEDKAIKKAAGIKIKKQKYRNTSGLGKNLIKKPKNVDLPE
jgi:hypothetical protein